MTSPELKKGQTISQFRVKAILPEGRGGMATVVRAQHPNGYDVALKIRRVSNDPYYSSALKAEVQILQKLDHSGVVKIFPINSNIGKVVYYERAIELEGHPWFFVMEFLDGGSLRDLLKRVGKLSVRESVTIAKDIASTLSFVHEQGYAHNDVKTDNILFRKKNHKEQNFQPVLIDFGIAAKLRRLQQDAGSIQWMSPERLQGLRGQLAPEIAANIDATKVDVYAMGILLYRMVTGKMPFTGITDGTITSAILKKIPEPVRSLNPEVPEELQIVIEDAMEKRAESRPTMQNIVKVLEPFASDALNL